MRSFATQTGGKLMDERCLELATRASVSVSLNHENILNVPNSDISNKWFHS